MAGNMRTMKVLEKGGASANHHVVMFKVLKVEEGVKELIVEAKYKVRADNGKVSYSTGPQSTPIKHAGVVHTNQMQLKSADHMLLTYEPWMKRIHPRASEEEFGVFIIDGSELRFVPSSAEFEPDFDNVVESSNPDIRHALFFRRKEADQIGEASHDPDALTHDLWWGTSLQSSKTESLLRCEKVGSSIVEDIPLSELVFAVSPSDAPTAVGPYAPPTASSFHPSPLNYQSGPGMKKLQHKQMGKSDANADSALASRI